MKVLIFFLCSFPILCICHSAYSKKYVGDNAGIYFLPRFDSAVFHNFPPPKSQTAENLGKLTTSLLHDLYVNGGKDFNVVLSPVSIWSILAMLLEGAGGRTENELKTKLQVSYNGHEDGRYAIRNRYQELLKSYQNGYGPTEFTSLNFVVSDKAKTIINPEYKNVIWKFYNGQLFEVDTEQRELFMRRINDWAREATKNRITDLISPDMLNNLLLIIGNAVYFKSKWKYPFNPSETILMPFMDEYERPIKNVPMMSQIAVLPYAYNSRLESECVELPYSDGVTSMIIFLPRERISLRSVLSRMRYLGVDEIIPKNFTEETIQLTIPRFRIASKIYLNEVLKRDLRSMFSPRQAEFPKIGKNIFVSTVAHKAEIENTEEGTAASAVSSVQFAYKISSTIFRANRPFIYLINEMKTRNIIFAGTYSNPYNAFYS